MIWRKYTFWSTLIMSRVVVQTWSKHNKFRFGPHSKPLKWLRTLWTGSTRCALLSFILFKYPSASMYYWSTLKVSFVLQIITIKVFSTEITTALNVFGALTCWSCHLVCRSFVHVYVVQFLSYAWGNRKKERRRTHSNFPHLIFSTVRRTNGTLGVYFTLE